MCVIIVIFEQCNLPVYTNNRWGMVMGWCDGMVSLVCHELGGHVEFWPFGGRHNNLRTSCLRIGNYMCHWPFAVQGRIKREREGGGGTFLPPKIYFCVTIITVIPHSYFVSVIFCCWHKH